MHPTSYSSQFVASVDGFAEGIALREPCWNRQNLVLAPLKARTEKRPHFMGLRRFFGQSGIQPVFLQRDAAQGSLMIVGIRTARREQGHGRKVVVDFHAHLFVQSTLSDVTSYIDAFPESAKFSGGVLNRRMT